MLVICHLPQDNGEGTLDRIRPSPVVVFYAASIPFVSFSAKMEHEAMVCNAFRKGDLCSKALFRALEHNTMPCSRLRSSAMCSNLAKTMRKKGRTKRPHGKGQTEEVKRKRSNGRGHTEKATERRLRKLGKKSQVDGTDMGARLGELGEESQVNGTDKGLG